MGQNKKKKWEGLELNVATNEVQLLTFSFQFNVFFVRDTSLLFFFALYSRKNTKQEEKAHLSSVFVLNRKPSYLFTVTRRDSYVYRMKNEGNFFLSDITPTS